MPFKWHNQIKGIKVGSWIGLPKDSGWKEGIFKEYEWSYETFTCVIAGKGTNSQMKLRSSRTRVSKSEYKLHQIEKSNTNQPKTSVKQVGLCSGWLWWTCWKKFPEVLWFNPRQQSRPTQQLTHPPPEELRQTIKRLKAVKLMGWDTDSFIGKAKPMHTTRAKQEWNSLLPRDRKVFSHSQ